MDQLTAVRLDTTESAALAVVGIRDKARPMEITRLFLMAIESWEDKAKIEVVSQDHGFSNSTRKYRLGWPRVE